MKFDENNIVHLMCPADKRTIRHRLKETAEIMNVKYQICKQCNPKVIVEIGVRAGYSAYAFMKACPKATYIGLDANNCTHGGQGNINRVYWEWAQHILKPFKSALFEIDTQVVDYITAVDCLKLKPDFFHVDGDHSQKGVIHDLNLAYKYLSTDGYILIDDIEYIPEVKDGVQEWLSKGGDLVINPVEVKYISSPRGECLMRKL